MPELNDFISQCDFTGAMTLLDFQLRTGEGDGRTLEWLAYAAFHNGDYKRALDSYDELLAAKAAARDGPEGAYGGAPGGGSGAGSRSLGPSGAPASAVATGGTLSSDMLGLCRAACLYFRGNHEESETAASAAPDCPLRTRLLLHLSARLGREQSLVAYHGKLSDKAKEDSLSKAAMHYQRAHYQEATDIYKRLLLDARDDAALHAYIAACYYRLDYYDVSLEILGVYLQARPYSPSAINLKACNHFKLYNGKAAEAELKALAGAWRGCRWDYTVRVRAVPSPIRFQPRLT
jgi:intraflagellar transport protein 56